MSGARIRGVRTPPRCAPVARTPPASRRLLPARPHGGWLSPAFPYAGLLPPARPYSHRPLLDRPYSCCVSTGSVAPPLPSPTAATVHFMAAPGHSCVSVGMRPAVATSWAGGCPPSPR